ncbi:hypothetical protein PENTCL1PPCAC_20099, partial [Pristionchus entomophagus]
VTSSLSFTANNFVKDSLIGTFFTPAPFSAASHESTKSFLNLSFSKHPISCFVIIPMSCAKLSLSLLALFLWMTSMAGSPSPASPTTLSKNAAFFP